MVSPKKKKKYILVLFIDVIAYLCSFILDMYVLDFKTGTDAFVHLCRLGNSQEPLPL